MIQNFALSLLLIVSLSACTGPQAPIFKRVDGLKATKISTREITISGDAVYHNPNGVSLTLTATHIDVILNDIPAAKINQDLEIEVPAQAEFRVPITFSAKPKDVYESDKGGVIGGAINALLNKKVDVRYEGTITVKMAGIPYTAPIEYEEEVALR